MVEYGCGGRGGRSVVRMAWALQCAKSHYTMTLHNEQGPDCDKVWKFVTDHWSAAEQMYALPALRDMCTLQGVASLQSHDNNFVDITVLYKVTVAAIARRVTSVWCRIF